MLFHNWWDGIKWHDWEQVGSIPTRQKPAAVSSVAGHIDVFGIGRDDRLLYQLTYDDNGLGFSDWQLVDPTVLTAGPGVSTWGPGRLDVFGRSSDGLLLHNFWDGSWHDFSEQLGTRTFVRAPAAVSWNFNQGPPNHIDVFANVRDDGPLLQLTYDDNNVPGWSDWQTLPGSPDKFSTAPAAVSWGRDHIELFARGAEDNILYQRTFDSFSLWGEWQQVSPIPMGSGPSPVAWGLGRIDLFALGPDGIVYHRWSQDGTWFP